MAYDKLIFSWVQRLEVQDEGTSRFSFSWGLSSWLTDDHFLPMYSYGLSSIWKSLASLSLLIKTPVPCNQGLTLRSPFNLNYLFKSPISKYNHILGYWVLGFNVWIWGDIIQSITEANKPPHRLRAAVIKLKKACHISGNLDVKGKNHQWEIKTQACNMYRCGLWTHLPCMLWELETKKLT